jgi:transcriptional regulator with XRE-family HTH domain
MDLHIGELIKQIIKKRQYTVGAIAKFINRERSVIYDIYNRETIDTGLLYTLSDVLNYDFFQVYSQKLQGTIDKVEEPIAEYEKLEAKKKKTRRVMIEVELTEEQYDDFLKEHTKIKGK